MKVTLNIQDDAELRNHIKEAINGQVLAIVREEFIEVVKMEIMRKIGTIGSRDFDQSQKSAFEAAAKTIIRENSEIVDWSNDFIKPMMREILNARIHRAVSDVDWNTMVNNLAKEKVKALIQ